MSRIHTPPPRALILGILAALIAVAVIALGLSGCGSSSPSSDQARIRTKPLETIFEASELSTAPGRTLDVLKRLGADDVKIFVPWFNLAPDAGSHTKPVFDAANPYTYLAFGQYDAIVRAAAARHIGVDVAIEGPAPLWATAPGIPPGTASADLGAWEPSAKEFGLFVSAVGQRYSGHFTPAGQKTPLPAVKLWSIWNEPNYGQDLAPQAIDHSKVEVSPAYYRSLLDAAWSALQQTGHAGERILIGEIAPRGHTLGDQPGNFSGMVPLRFIRALYCVDQSLQPLTGTDASQRGCPSDSGSSAAFARDNPGLFQAAGFAFHPYPQQFGPTVPTAPDGLGADYADLPQLGKLERTLDGAFAAYGAHNHIDLYDTEFGYQTNPPEKILRAIPPDTAAGYANQAEYMSWRDPRVVSWDQYLLTDPPGGASSFDTGLRFANGKPKALYDAFRMPLWLPVTKASASHPLEVWGDVRPAHELLMGSHKPQVAEIQLQAAGQSKWQTVKQISISDPYGYFDTRVTFPSSGKVRIAWSSPHGPTIHSRTVPITVR